MLCISSVILLLSISVLCLSHPFDVDEFFTNLREVDEPQIIVYNRIPKCASSTIIALLGILANYNNVILLNTNATFWNRPFHSRTYLRRHFYNHILSALKRTGRVIVVGHWQWHELDAHEFDGISVEYINMMRDCSSRLKSHIVYNFENSVLAQHHRTSGTLHQFHNSLLGSNMSLEECVSSVTCLRNMRSPTTPDIMTAYIGGSTETNNKPSLATAIKHINYTLQPDSIGYVAVGMEEHMQESLSMLECLLPSYFTGLTQLYQEQHISAKRYSTNTHQLNMTLLHDQFCQDDEVLFRHAYHVFRKKVQMIQQEGQTICRKVTRH